MTIQKYWKVLRNLPHELEILALRIKDTQAKVTGHSTMLFGVDQQLATINLRLADRPTNADLVVLESRLGGRLDLLEHDRVVVGYPGPVGGVKVWAPVQDLPAEPTGEPNLFDITVGDKITIAEGVEIKPTKARKPKAPKGGAE